MNRVSTGSDVPGRCGGGPPAQWLYGWCGAAERLGVTERQVQELWARRELGGTKIGKHVRFSDADLRDYIERHRVEAKR